jgi:hypothetical protein
MQSRPPYESSINKAEPPRAVNLHASDIGESNAKPAPARYLNNSMLVESQAKKEHAKSPGIGDALKYKQYMQTKFGEKKVEPKPAKDDKKFDSAFGSSLQK